jgi:hypothetical protein
MARRERPLGPADEQALRALFERSASERRPTERGTSERETAERAIPERAPAPGTPDRSSAPAPKSGRRSPAAP